MNNDLPKSLERIEAKLDVLITILGGQNRPAQTTQETHANNSKDVEIILRGLTAKQNVVLQLLIEGYSNAKIAEVMDVGDNTVKIHVRTLCKKLGMKNRSQTAIKGHELLHQITPERYEAVTGGLPINWAKQLKEGEDDPYKSLYAPTRK